MLESLDTLIALCVILAAASMLVTVVVQMISAMFALRGKQMAQGLSHVLQGISPATDAEIRRLVNQIMLDPHLTGEKGLANADKHCWLKFWGNSAKMVAAIRPEEVYAALKKLADGMPEGEDAFLEVKRLAAEAEKLVLARGEAATNELKKYAKGLADAVALLESKAMTSIDGAKAVANELEEKVAELMAAQQAGAAPAAGNPAPAAGNPAPAVGNPAPAADGDIIQLKETAEKWADALAVMENAISLSRSGATARWDKLKEKLGKRKRAALSFRGMLLFFLRKIKVAWARFEKFWKDRNDAAAPAVEEDPLKTLAKTARQLLTAFEASDDKSKQTTVLNSLYPAMQIVTGAVLDRETRENISSSIIDASKKLVTVVDEARASFDKTFQAAQDKAQELFLKNVRRVTVVMGIFLALLFQWDAAEIYSQVSAPDGTMREALVKQAGTVLELAQKTGVDLNLDTKGQVSPSGGLVERIGKEWNSTHKDTEWPQSPGDDKLKDYKTVLQLKSYLVALAGTKLAAEVKTKFDEFIKAEKVEPNASLAPDLPAKWDAACKLPEWPQSPKGDTLKNLKDVKSFGAYLEARKTSVEVQDAFEKFSEAQVAEYVKEKEELFKKVASLDGFEMIPKNFWRWSPHPGEPAWEKTHAVAAKETGDWWNWICGLPGTIWNFFAYYGTHMGHLFGVLIFGALLSMGAPFWFNMLKNLTDLRPALAKMLDQTGAPGSNTAPTGKKSGG